MNNQSDNQQGGFSPYILAQMIAPGNIQQPGLYPAGNQAGDMYYGADGIRFNRLAIGTNGQYLTIVNNKPSWGTITLPVVPTDGWIASTDTFVYVSSSSFKIVGVNRTTIYQTGTLVKFTNNSAVYYGIVASSVFSSDTTVTLIANADYSINNSVITSPSYSYQPNPQGFPSAFNYTPSWVGFSANPTGNGRFYTIGRRCFVKLTPTGNGTSNATNLTVTGPVAAKQTDNVIGIANTIDNGSVLTTPGRIASAGTNVFTIIKDFSNASWTNSGTKNINASWDYEF